MAVERIDYLNDDEFRQAQEEEYEEGQKYWYIDFGTFLVRKDYQDNWWPEITEDRLKNNNVFLTKHEAQSALKKIKKVLMETSGG